MRRSWTRVALLAAASVALAAPSFAHHSLSMYNINTKKFLTGTVKEFEWANPHSFIRILVRKSDGMTELWSFEGAGVGSLSRVG